MRVIALASGSKGNCVAIESKAGNLLIDCGINLTQLHARAKSVEFDLSKVTAVLITHEHTDHVKGLEIFSQNYKAPVYMHPSCFKALNNDNINYAGDNKNYELGFELGEFKVLPFRTPHDSDYSVGYRVENEGKSFALATDLGFVTNGVFSSLQGADAVMLESNHDVEMLKHCKYPQYVKTRIMSNTGHLSNAVCAETIKRLSGYNTRQFLLGHLSQESNTHKLAMDTLGDFLDEFDDIAVSVAGQDRPSREVIF